MIVLNTRKYRRAMEVYRRNWGLEKQKGFTIETGKPLGIPARKLLLRIQKNLVARKVLPKKYATGILNSKTQVLLIPPLSSADKAVDYALSQVGVHESPWGSNRGHDVERYQSSTGAYHDAWCASFFWYCWQKAGYNGPTSAGAWYTTDRIGTRQTIKTAKPGDGVSLNTGKGHIGILLTINHSAWSVTLVAGNTSDSVKQKNYPISMIHSISRPVMH